ncbi:MAG: restriction endonuclease [Planctomycetota bacterium]|nr:restriction endonuclease [Planctomycetota bacterium]
MTNSQDTTPHAHDTIDRIMDQIHDAGYGRCRLYSVGEDVFRGVAQRGLQFHDGRSFADIEIAKDTPTIGSPEPKIHRESDFPRFYDEFGLGDLQWIHVPLLHDGKPIGVLAVDNMRLGESPTPFTDDDIAVLQGFAAPLTEALIGNNLQHSANDVFSLRQSDHEVVFVQTKIVSATDVLIQRLRDRPEDLFSLTSRQFEQLIADILDDLGWAVTLTGETRDGGRDILAYLSTDVGPLLCLVEAKRYATHRPVGVDLVRTLYGTLCHEQANAAMLVTTSSFSSDARKFQSCHNYQLSLKEYSDVVDWINAFGSRR